MTRKPDPVALPMWAIYDRPTDYPDSFVVRRWDIYPGHAIASIEVQLADTLEAARQLLPSGLTRLARSPHDETQIVETWL